MKCGILIAVPIQACAPAPTPTRSVRPLKRSGTKTISESPPTSSRSITGERIEPALAGAAAAKAEGGVDGVVTGELVIDYTGDRRDRWTDLPVVHIKRSVRARRVAESDHQGN